MKRITLITLTFFVAITLISCKGKSEKAVAQNTQQEVTGMAAAFMKSAEKYGKSPYGAHLKKVAEGKIKY